MFTFNDALRRTVKTYHHELIELIEDPALRENPRLRAPMRLALEVLKHSPLPAEKSGTHLLNQISTTHHTARREIDSSPTMVPELYAILLATGTLVEDVRNQDMDELDTQLNRAIRIARAKETSHARD